MTRSGAPVAVVPSLTVTSGVVGLALPVVSVVAGASLTAGERFLSILSAEGGGLAQVRLLRPGEEADGWRLTAIEGDVAVLRHGTETRRLPVPAR